MTADSVVGSESSIDVGNFGYQKSIQDLADLQRKDGLDEESLEFSLCRIAFGPQGWGSFPVQGEDVEPKTV